MVARWAIMTVGLAMASIANGQEYKNSNSDETPHYWATFSDELKSGGNGPLMVPIDGGKRFRMGCVSGIRCLLNEPVREVVIERAFAMSVYEITRGEFKRFVQQTGYMTDGERTDIPWPIGKKPVPQVVGAGAKLRKYKRYCVGLSAEDIRAHLADGFDDVQGEHTRLWTWRNTGYEQTDEHPAVCISWSDAAEYVKWLAAETGRPYRLPSEAEWEYAARAGPLSMESYADPSSWHGHNNLEPGYSNFLAIQQVGRSGPNALGLYDIGSNVAEWTADCWNRDFQDAPVAGSARISGRCSYRVYRDLLGIRRPPLHELRLGLGIHYTTNHLGFRVAASPTY